MSSPSEDDQAIFSAVLDTALGVGAAARIQAGDSVTSKQGEILSVALRTRRTMRKSDERTSDESKDDEARAPFPHLPTADAVTAVTGATTVPTAPAA